MMDRESYYEYHESREELRRGAQEVAAYQEQVKREQEEEAMELILESGFDEDSDCPRACHCEKVRGCPLTRKGVTRL